ncbi:MAG: hypothetical protein JSV23_00515 [Promethearchaeota archaeon]|nr:MAG: hypothetical protein JSV23_00515 [Candidatus Lokiarchaeota archaeon]
MARGYLLALKIINLAVFTWILIVFVTTIFHFEEVVVTAENELVILAFFGALKNVISYIIYGGLFAIAYGCAFIFGGGFNSNLFNFIEGFFQGYLSKWFSIPQPEFYNIPSLIWSEFQVLFNDIYLFIFQVLFVISIIYAIRAFFKSDPKYSLVAIGSIILMIIVPLMVEGLRDMFQLFNLPPDFLNLHQMTNPLDPSLSGIPLDNFILFITSPLIVFGIISYIYIELAFQISYADTVTKPSLERSDRLEAQLNILARESHYITANIDKIKEEAKKKIIEIESEQKEGLAIGKFLAKTGKRFSYVKEMIERRKLEEEEKKLVTAASKTRRLGRYIDRLFREDSEAKDTLTASSSAPRARNLALSTLFSFTYRVGLLLIISYIIIHPHWFLGTVIQLPASITESVAMYSPEAIIILLLPIMLLFPVISRLISFIKHRNLIIRLQQEGRIKELLTSVGDYVRKEEVKPPVKEETEEVASEAT